MRTIQHLSPILAVTLALAACGGEADTATGDTGSGDSDTAGENASAAAPVDGFGVETVRVTFAENGTAKGTSTLWIDGYGAKAALVEEVQPAEYDRRATYWDGTKAWFQNGDQDATGMALRPKFAEPADLAGASEAERTALGWTKGADRTVAGKSCTVWTTENMGGIELCQWQGIDLVFKSGAIDKQATEVVEGEAIPAEIAALAQ